MVTVKLNGRFGYGKAGARAYYGPGVCEVPEGLARALGLQPLPADATEVHEAQETGGQPADAQEPGQAVPPAAAADLYADFGADLGARLAAAYPTLGALRAAGDAELLAIDGVGAATLRRLRAQGLE